MSSNTHLLAYLKTNAFLEATNSPKFSFQITSLYFDNLTYPSVSSITEFQLMFNFISWNSSPNQQLQGFQLPAEYLNSLFLILWASQIHQRQILAIIFSFLMSPHLLFELPFLKIFSLWTMESLLTSQYLSLRRRKTLSISSLLYFFDLNHSLHSGCHQSPSDPQYIYSKYKQLKQCPKKSFHLVSSPTYFSSCFLLLG